MMVLLSRTVFLCFNFLVAINIQAKDLHLKDFINPKYKDATPAIYQMLQEAHKYDQVRIIIEKGVYHLYPEKAFEKYSYVSNHDNSMRRIAFPLVGFKDLQIIGSDAHFIVHGLMMPFSVENCVKISISGISIDWNIPLHSEALVISSNEADSTFDLKIDEAYPYVIRNERLIFIKEGYEHDLGRGILFDPTRHAVAYNTMAYTPLEVVSKLPVRNREQMDFPNYVDTNAPEYAYQTEDWNLKATELRPGIVRVKMFKKPPPVGMVLVTKGRTANSRVANAFHINRSKDIALKDIRIYHAGGMGVICERSENILLEKVQILARPGSGRMVSTGADATHFVSCRGFVKMNNCVFRNMLDDGTNVHSAYLIIDTIMSRRSVGVRVGHHQQRGFLFAEKGDKVGFVERALSTIPKFFNTVEAIDHVNEQFYILTFKEDLPDNINSDLVIENLDWYPELSITNCTVADNRARGFLISTPRKAIIENNYFSTMMSGILIPEELSYWYESGQAQNVLIRNNQFGDCSYGGGKTPVIQIHTAINKAGYAFGRIVIEGNRFHHFDAAILQANSAKSLEFVNNRITRSKTFQPLHPHLPVLQFDHIQNLKVRSNSYDGSLRGKVLIKDIEFSDVDL